MEKYYKNFILCGEADYYCLICQEAFIVNEVVDKHLRWANHRKNIKDLEYAPKFRKDFIYKISNCFYCEICNVVIKSAAEHINEDHHQAVKSSNMSKKPSNISHTSDGAIKINELKLTKHQWHSIIDGSCLICEETVTNAFTHFTLFNHMVKLIQSETIYKDNQYYRKLGKEKYYCFTCFKTNNSIESHSIAHIKGIAEENRSSDTINLNKEPQGDDNNIRSDIMKILMDLNRDYFVFDVKNNTATCQKCEEIVEADLDPLCKHRTLHDSYVYIYRNRGKARAELKIYGKQNFIHLNEGGSKGCCSLCNIHLSANIKVFKQHVEGAIHRGHLQLKGLIPERQQDKPKYKTKTMKEFLKSRFGPFKVEDLTLLVINHSICLEKLSFAGVKLVDDFKSIKGKCFVCDVLIDVAKIPKHIMMKKHMNSITAWKVLPIKTNGNEEFVRQIKTGLYHCGFCNNVIPYWENVERHLKSLTHKVQTNKKKLLGIVGSKAIFNPSVSVEEIEEYQAWRNID